MEGGFSSVSERRSEISFRINGRICNHNVFVEHLKRCPETEIPSRRLRKNQQPKRNWKSREDKWGKKARDLETANVKLKMASYLLCCQQGK